MSYCEVNYFYSSITNEIKGFLVVMLPPELVLPVDQEHDVYTILGVILCLRHVMPHLSRSNGSHAQGLKDSFGYREAEKEEGVSTEQMIKVSLNQSNRFCKPSCLFLLFILSWCCW